jgi:acyl-CoA synthetase (AMP-forming)/AMP-acid ligase II
MSDPSSNPRAADAAATLVDLLRAQAAAQGDALAFTFLEDGRTESGRTDYAALDADARRIAGWLQADHAPGERALLLFPAGLDFVRAFFGCLYAGLIPIPAPAPEASRRKRTMPRLRSIVRDAEVTLTLSTGDALALVRDAGRDVPELEAVPVRDPAEAPARGRGGLARARRRARRHRLSAIHLGLDHRSQGRDADPRQRAAPLPRPARRLRLRPRQR